MPRCQLRTLGMSVTLLTCALGYGQVSANSTASTSSTAGVRSPAAGGCYPYASDGFITSMVMCSDQLTDEPLSMAQVGSHFYLAYGDDFAHFNVALLTDNGKSLSRADPPFPLVYTIAGYQGNLYGANFSGVHQIQLFRANLDSSGKVAGFVTLGTSAQTTDNWPTLSSSQNSLLMAWQSRQDPPRLGFSKFGVPSDPNADFLTLSAAVYQQFVAKTRPSIAVIGKTIYVAFEADYGKSQVVAFAEDGKTILGEFTSIVGFRFPSIAAVGDRLFLAYYWYQGNGLNFTEVKLNPDGTPKGFGPPYSPTFAAPLQHDTAGVALISTPSGLLMAWRWAPHYRELRIGTISIK
jgi:hypothetical protein